MLREDGEALLRSFSERAYQRKVTRVEEGVWHALGLGHGNATDGRA